MGPLTITRPMVFGTHAFTVLLLLLFVSLPTAAAQLTFAVHPVLPPERTVQSYQPLVNYLEKATGYDLELVTTSNFLVHWQMLRRGKYDLILDGPHFTDYRIKKMGYRVLAKFPAVVSYTLVANPDAFILEPMELVGKAVATTPAPALGALRLGELFPNPLRQPRVVETADSLEAAQMAVDGKVPAAIIPAPLVGRFPNLTTVVTTPQVPAPAFSAGPNVETAVAESLRKALLEAGNTPAGKKALEALNIEAFEPAEAADYAGHSRLLERTWGY